MTRRCEVTGKMAQVGNSVSHANNKTLRRFEVNVQKARIYSESLKKFFVIKLTPAGHRTIEHNGGLDSWILSIAPTKVDVALRDIRKQILAATTKAA